MEKRPALGKGLSALIPDAAEPGFGPLEIDIDRLSPNALQPRPPSQQVSQIVWQRVHWSLPRISISRPPQTTHAVVCGGSRSGGVLSPIQRNACSHAFFGADQGHSICALAGKSERWSKAD